LPRTRFDLTVNQVVLEAMTKRELGFAPRRSVEDGVIEVRDAIHLGIIKDAGDQRYRNAQFIVQ
jgi:hypothetical protein